MQEDYVKRLVEQFKARSDVQVTTTTIGEFLGPRGDQVALKLGDGVLSRPILVAESKESTQLLDLKKGWVIVLDNIEEAPKKIITVFSGAGGRQSVPLDYFAKENIATETVYDELLNRCSTPEGFTAHIREINQAIQKSARTGRKAQLIEKTIELLGMMKDSGAVSPVERGKLARAQERLSKLIHHSNSKAIAAGQIPAVFEIAVWEWVKGDAY